MGREELQLKTRQVWLWMLVFSCLALIHSPFTGWLAPLGLFFARQFVTKHNGSAFAVGIGAALSVSTGVVVGLLDALWLRTVPSVGTAFLFAVALTGLGECAFPSAPRNRWWFGLHGLFLTVWGTVFLLLLVFR